MAGKSRFSFVGGLVDPNSIFIRNNYVYFKFSNPKTLVKEVEQSDIKVNQISATEQAKELAEGKQEVESGKRSLPEDEPYEQAPPKKRRRQTTKGVKVYSVPDALD